MGLRESWAATNRFRESCEADERVIAAFLGGSLAADRADDYSDLDLYVILNDATACSGFVHSRRDFIATWGEPVFDDVTENFFGLGFDMVHFVLSDGVSGELAVGHRLNFHNTHGGPYRVLFDAEGILDDVEFPLVSRSRRETSAEVRRSLSWFWLHVIALSKALGRGELWAAQSHLHQLRTAASQLVESSGPTADLRDAQRRALTASFVGFDGDEIRAAAIGLCEIYRSIAPAVAARHALAPPVALAAVAEAKLR